ncbi:FxsB family cyclophane-forming radical SAM/SPASM peptide maturase [Catenulispora pinisilvae]|uniref:FxsB family cyclophane-forming radical SAM/SPASM peptide maturase n=1 Tax=Catenulispora pinisilvae TaxID=2705253 RepID=UPI001892328C|nr:FxsB family cyclophane-forming radical SAM/SPASM peptide maturase [Catenulispora pinisilvae]
MSSRSASAPGTVGVVFRQFVIKIAGRCDLACDHCYVFEHADQSWRGRPNLMPPEIMTAVAARIAEHARAHALSGVTVILHGGEPLLAGVDRIRFLIRALRAALPPGCSADFRIQTNGLQLDDAFCELFLQEGVGVGISIDGGQGANDRHRRHADGRTSYPELVRAIRLIGSQRYRPVFNGLLCTIDVENDPVEVFDALSAFAPPRVEFLLPHATWVNPPPGAVAGEPRYAQWLLAVHRRWAERGRPMDVRLFHSVADLIAGRTSRTEAIGLGPTDVVVVETDGEIEQEDSLKTAYDGAPATGFHVSRNSFDEAGSHPGFDGRTVNVAAPSPVCERCPVVRICGGGLYAHRYDGSGFANPSVYCRDLYTFITSLASERHRAPKITRHRMGAADFAALGRGQGSEEAVAALRTAQLSKARVKLGQLSKPLRAEHSWALVQEFDTRDRGVVNRVLADPFLMPAEGRDALGPAGTLARIALSCAVLSSTPVELDLVAAQDRLALPAVGTLATAAGPCHVAVDEKAAITVNGLSVEPIRHEARIGPITVRLEDHDPARNRFGHPVAGPLSAAELFAWRDDLDAAAGVLAERHPEVLAEMAEGLTTVVPLKPHPGRHRSATARNAFGALGVALPGPAGDPACEADGEALTCLLLHEFQHLKLGAVLDMFDLHDKSDAGSYPVGWRRDLRSLEAVLQGAYAHMAVVEYWRRRALATRRSGSQEEYARRSTQVAGHVRAALAQITVSPALTPLGRRWVADMAAGAARWR